MPGVIRGNHHHLLGTEIIAVVGLALVRFRENNQVQDIDIPPEKVFRFTFLPHITHAIKSCVRQVLQFDFS